MEYGFTLNPALIADAISDHMAGGGWWLSTYYDSFARSDFRYGMWIEHDPVDRAVVVFVGPRKQAAAVEQAARSALTTSGGKHGR